ncbi:TetR family transcriptional regulator [Actinophytocola sp.]|uniref:TetR family transcriptional regulator n=1 Tax=Actinophytocola sp. TaxID=1872138 RepID=UPI002ED9CB30
MAGDAEATRRRLLDAAAREFAEHGIAGARVDRIAAAARSNKAQIYHYFTSKDGLFDAVLRELAEAILRDAPIDATDLPGYAGRLFDRFADDPVSARLANWYQLERAGGKATVDLVVASTTDKVAAVAKAQADGLIPDHFAPVDLLALVVHLASLWHSVTPEVGDLTAEHTRAHRRQVVVDAVSALVRD